MTTNPTPTPAEIAAKLEGCVKRDFVNINLGFDEDEAATILTEWQAAIARETREWRSMDEAPDDEVVEVVARYPDATAGFPQFAMQYENGHWYSHGRRERERVIPWAWRPRDPWPHEDWLTPAPQQGENQ